MGSREHRSGDHFTAAERLRIRRISESGQVRIAKRQLAARNYAGAARWFRRAADQGNAEAQYWLAMMYRAGKGVPRDSRKALELLHSAARQGHTRARLERAAHY